MNSKPGPRFLFPLFGLFLGGTAAILLVLGWYVVDSHRAVQGVLRREFRLKELAGSIVHLDEVLTMSARMAASTGDLRWEQRYRHFEPQLDAAIKEAVRLAPSAYMGKTAVQTDTANIKLVEMENQSFAAVRRGDREEASRVLFSDAYETQKAVYAQGMALMVDDLKAGAEEALRRMRRRTLYSAGMVAVVLPLLLLAWVLLLWMLRGWKRALMEKNMQLEYKSRETEELNRTLDEKVAQRTAELEKEVAQRKKTEAVLEAKLRELEFMNKIMMDREEKILELKEQIRTLTPGDKGN